MTKLFLSFFTIALLVSCSQEAKVPGEVVKVKYSTSLTDFESTFSSVDSIRISTHYSKKSRFFVGTEANTLNVHLFYSNEAALEEHSLPDIVTQFKENASKDISNIDDFDVIQVDVYKGNEVISSREVHF